METCGLVKKEPMANEYCESKADFYSTFEPWQFIKNEPEEDDFYDATSESSPTFESKPSCDMKLKIDDFIKVEEGNEDACATMSFYHPRVSVPLVSQSKESTTKPNPNLKMESVELETLTEDTLVQPSQNYSYALPGDFGAVTNTCGQDGLLKDGMETETADDNVAEKLMEKTCDVKIWTKLVTFKSPLPESTTEIDNSRILKEKLTDQTSNLNFKTESVELETLTNNTILKRSPSEYRYASPWDFVLNETTCNQSNWEKNTLQSESLHNKLPEKVTNKEYKDENSNSCFLKSPPFSTRTSEIQNSRFAKKKFIQPTLKFDSSATRRSRNQNSTVKVSEKFFNGDDIKLVSERQPQSSTSHASSIKSYSCKLCNQNFTSERNLSQHKCNKCSHSNKAVNKYTCDICGRPVVDSWQLRKHRQTHDPTRRYQCDVCGKKFKLKHYLRQHLITHNLGDHPCDYCPRHYTRKSTLRRHMKVHKRDSVKNDALAEQTCKNDRAPSRKPSQSIMANNSAQTQQNLENNDKTLEEPEKLYKCDICGESFDKKSSIRVHIEFLHLEVFFEDINKPQSRSSETNRLVDSSKKRFQCRICKKRYTQSSHLYRHQQIHQTTKSHFCELCDQYFTTSSALTRHLLKKHDKKHFLQKKPQKISKNNKTSKITCSREFPCKICDKSFTNLTDLRRHCAIHDGRKPYECDICKKQFAVKGYLYAHILTHGNWREYPCECCSKVYRRKSSLQRHINISHLMKKKYECSICKKSCDHESSYDEHMNSIHGESTK